MRLMWVQQWAVLPVIVEDREMLEDNGQGGRLPPGGQPMDPSARARLSEREGPFQPRTFLPYPVILSLASSHPLYLFIFSHHRSC